MPCLDAGCLPPEIIGTGVLAGAMANGAAFTALAAEIERLDRVPAARLYDYSILNQLVFRRTEALQLQDVAAAASPLFRVRRGGLAAGALPPAKLRLLALVVLGDLMANTPLDFITNHLDVQLDLLFLVPGQPLPPVVPEHDVMFFAASEPDAATLARMHGLFTAWPRPALNAPGFLPTLERERLAAALAGLPGIRSPATALVSRAAVSRLLASKDGPGVSLSDLLPGAGYPLLIRPSGSHAGVGLERIDGPVALAAYLAAQPARSYYLSAFIDYRSADGLYRKYRIAFIDREPHLCHMAVSEHWMVHYLNAGMAESAGKRADEAHAMQDFARGFAARHGAAFAALHEMLPFDYYSIDCSELPDGRLLVFEADTVAIIHLMDSAELYPYKQAQMRGIFDAFGGMLSRRAAIRQGG